MRPPRIERLAIVDGRSRKARPCAWLDYDRDDNEFGIRIAEDVSPEEVPLMMVPFVERGIFTMDATWSRKWVEERIVPPGRQNLGEVLKAHQLDEYDEFALLVAGKGKSSNDDFIVMPLENTPDDASGSIPGATPADSAETRFIESIGEAFAAARKERGLTQHELASRAGVDQAVVSRLENGRSNPTASLIAAVANALDLEPHFSLSQLRCGRKPEGSTAEA